MHDIEAIGLERMGLQAIAVAKYDKHPGEYQRGPSNEAMEALKDAVNSN